MDIYETQTEYASVMHSSNLHASLCIHMICVCHVQVSICTYTHTYASIAYCMAYLTQAVEKCKQYEIRKGINCELVIR